MEPLIKWWTAWRRGLRKKSQRCCHVVGLPTSATPMRCSWMQRVPCEDGTLSKSVLKLGFECDLCHLMRTTNLEKQNDMDKQWSTSWAAWWANSLLLHRKRCNNLHAWPASPRIAWRDVRVLHHVNGSLAGIRKCLARFCLRPMLWKPSKSSRTQSAIGALRPWGIGLWQSTWTLNTLKLCAKPSWGSQDLGEALWKLGCELPITGRSRNSMAKALQMVTDKVWSLVWTQAQQVLFGFATTASVWCKLLENNFVESKEKNFGSLHQMTWGCFDQPRKIFHRNIKLPLMIIEVQLRQPLKIGWFLMLKDNLKFLEKNTALFYLFQFQLFQRFLLHYLNQLNN